MTSKIISRAGPTIIRPLLLGLIAVSFVRSGLAQDQLQPAASPPGGSNIVERLNTHHWVVDELKSPMDDSRSVQFSLLSSDTSVTVHSPKLMVLILSYREHKWTVMLTASEYLGLQSPRVMLRWNEGVPETEIWVLNVKQTGALAPSPKKFLAQALNAKKLVARLYPQLTGEATMVFDLGGLTEKIDKYPEAKNSLGN